MQLRCYECNKVISTEVPDETIIRGWLQCPECASELPEPIVPPGLPTAEELAKGREIASKFHVLANEAEIMLDTAIAVALADARNARG